MRVLSFVALTCAALTGCSAECDVVCGPCAPPLELRVRLASGAVPMNVTIDGADLVCTAPFDGQVACTADALALGTHALTVRADGEAPVELSVTLAPDGGGCCSCGYQPISRDVVLGDGGDAGM